MTITTAHHIKLLDQIARQQPELTALQADIAAATPGVQALADALASADAAMQAAMAALQARRDGISQAGRAAEAAQAVLADPDATAEQQAQAQADLNQALADADLHAHWLQADTDAATAAQAAHQAAQQAHAGPSAELAALQARAAAIGAAVAQCQADIEAGGLSLSAQDVAAARLSDQRALVWERIKARREAVKAAGVPLAGKWFHSDDGSRIQQLGLVMMGAAIPDGLQWKTMDGSFVTMTQTLAGQVFAATAARDVAVFAVAEQHRAALNAAADPLTYDWSGGWPATF